ncbi:MAG: glycosyltransferase family 4 protein, partial [Candidatus Jordarchaeum sp.]|uniref:glycosyltransferase family 4 protein n=1 Tax=Candidatus Jordarchaeum sp. TaxID=2823881 RepID=UPI0040490843
MPPEKIFVVPNGANYFFDIRKRNVNNKNKIRILFLSNLGKEKGAFDVLEAVPKVVKIHNNVEFIFAGDRRNEETINEFIKFIKANPLLPITLTGPLYGKAKTDLLLSGDVFVFPPREPEGHPWAIVEAMAAGLPIITTDQGAIKESVKDGVNGFIVEKRNPHQIAEKIKFLIENPDVRKKMG